MIAFACAQCGIKLKVKPELAGRQGKCPTCKQPLTVPAAARAAAFVPPKQIDGEDSSLARHGVSAEVTLEWQPGGKHSVRDALAGRKGKERYVIDSEIARGGMGAVMRAVDCDLRRVVAVKYLLDDQDPTNTARFIEEAQINSQLEHPNIVPVYDLGIDASKRAFILMKLVKGRSLKDVLDQLRQQPKLAGREFTLGRLLNILVNVCNALAYAHARGVIHRDLKPANLMLGDFGEVYVMDWGLAKVRGQESGVRSQESAQKVATSRDAADLTQDGMVLGTPVYMPPEQARGLVNDIDARSDVYALGAILYELLTLLPPVDTEGGQLAILIRVMEGEITPPELRTPARARAGQIPQELSAIAMKALAKTQADRYASVEALRRDLELFQEGRSVSAKVDTTPQMLWKLAKRNKAVSAALAVLLPLLLVLGGATLKNYRDKEARTKEAVPALIRSAYLLAYDGQWKDALDQTDLALTYEPGSPEARLLKGQLYIAQKNFPAGRGELEEYLRQRPDDADASKLLELLAKARVGDSASLAALAEVLQRQRAYGMASALLQDVQRTLEARQPLLPIYRKQIEAAWPGLGNRLTLESNGQFNLHLVNLKQVTSLLPLKGMPLERLNLVTTPVTDLAPLRDMPLLWLNLSNTPVQDLEPLRGLKLNELYLGSCTQVRDLSPLQDMPLSLLNLAHCPQIRDLTPLSKMPLQTLSIHGCSVVDLAPLKGRPITWLAAGVCPIKDLSPLRGMPLTYLSLNQCAQIEDLRPLQDMALTALELRNCTSITDLRPLRGMKLTTLEISGTKAADLTPLEGMPLVELNFSPKMSAKTIHVIRAMKSLKIINPDSARKMPAEEFWKRYDAGEFK